MLFLKIWLFASHLKEHFNFAEIILKFVGWSFFWIKSIVVSSNCRNVTYRSSSRPVAGTFTYRPSSSAISKITHILYRRNVVEFLSNTYTFEKVRGSFFKYIEKRKRRCFCVEIEPSLQGLKGEPSNKIGSRNRHQWSSSNPPSHFSKLQFIVCKMDILYSCHGFLWEIKL